MDEQEEDQTAEILDGDDKSVMTAVTGIQLSQEKQTEYEDNNKKDDEISNEINKMQDANNERLMRYQQTPNLMKYAYK
eukprot:3026361-Ditylum_brightwellii.AAC.1